MSEAGSSRVAIGAFVVAVVVFLGAALVATRVDAGRAAPASAPPVTEPAVVDDEYAPLPSLTVFRNGQPLQLAGPRPKPALLHLWATWCGPCRAELPLVFDYGNSGEVEVIALSVDDHWPAVEAYFIAGIPAAVAWDPKIVVEPAMGVRSLPTTFLLDTDGRVRRTWVGAQNWADPAVRRSVALAAR